MTLELLKFGGASGSEPGMLGTKAFFPAATTGWYDGLPVLNSTLLFVSLIILGIKGI
jgi:hypothetical protein